MGRVVAARLPLPGGPAWPLGGPGTVHVTTCGERSFTPEAKPEPSQTSPGFRILELTFLLLFSPRWVPTHQRKAVRIQRASGPHPTASPSPPWATLWHGLSDQGSQCPTRKRTVLALCLGAELEHGCQGLGGGDKEAP